MLLFDSRWLKTRNQLKPNSTIYLMVTIMKVTNSDLIDINLIGQRVANSTVEYSAFNRLVLGSNPRRPI